MKQITCRDVDALKRLVHGDHPLELPPHNGKTVIVFWTGGVDSTFLVFYYLMQGYTVMTQWVDIINNSGKTEAEKAARKAVINELKSIFEPTKLFARLHVMGLPLMRIDFRGKSRADLPQALIWVLATSFFTVDHDIVMGYCNGDDALAFLPQIKKFIKSMNVNMLHTPVNAYFPLIGMKKEWFAAAMPQAVLKATHSCEYVGEPDYEKETCQCAPCRRRRFEIGQ
ncbi:QueC-like queuosine biosynthesis [Serratia phage phiMAM1]|uniref:Putative alpha hydrolase n=1 Tax=Serratia phage phiMAM1 TaxID=1262513 RepID=K7Z9T1_9CAUD|nr:QueC-like queuosine biosynthesis [Serratia phage phiMAM1]AFX93643.1 putative alpha hydrolase [Serratia phage phiMAM1]